MSNIRTRKRSTSPKRCITVRTELNTDITLASEVLLDYEMAENICKTLVRDNKWPIRLSVEKSEVKPIVAKLKESPVCLTVRLSLTH
jgi:hypothetical protein